MSRLILFLLVLWQVSAAQTSLPAKVTIRGAYSSPKSFWATGATLPDYGINAIFVHHGSISEELLARARHEGAKVFAEFATLNGKGYVDKHPEAWPINERGEKEPAATWFMGVCPTDPVFRKSRMVELEKLLASREIDGVWMDYVHWHAQFEDPKPILPETCFSPSCMEAFEKATGIKAPPGQTAERARWILANHDKAWRDWRCSVIVSWAEEMRQILRKKRPDLLLGLYHAPWNDTEFGGARRRILGLDFQKLAQVVDVFSPMVYHGRMGRPPAWVGEHIKWFSDHLKLAPGRPPLVWPIVQAHGEPVKISAQEFEQVMLQGVTGAATGVMMFTIGSVAEDPAKMEVLKRLYAAGR